MNLAESRRGIIETKPEMQQFTKIAREVYNGIWNFTHYTRYFNWNAPFGVASCGIRRQAFRVVCKK